MNDTIVLVIPDYPDKILTAKARRPILYTSGLSKVKGRTNIPKTFLNTDKYFFNDKGVLICRKTNEPQLANPQLAGKPRYWVVNFQDIWNQSLAKQSRAMMIDKLKDALRPYIKSLRKIRSFPIELSITLYDAQCPVDISNRGAVYTKVVEDLLVKEGIIPDDSAPYINCSGRTKFIPLHEDGNSKKRMEIRITGSDYKPFK